MVIILLWMRNMPFLPYNIWDYFGGTYNQSPWNCVILTPSFEIQAQCFQPAEGGKSSLLADGFDIVYGWDHK